MTKEKRIVRAILDDLESRKGIGNELEEVDKDVYEEIVEELEEIVLGFLQEPVKNVESRMGQCSNCNTKQVALEDGICYGCATYTGGRN